MSRNNLRVPALAALALVVLALAACGPRGEDGTSYLALDWTYEPQSVYFPALPPGVDAGIYYPHPEGVHLGEYVAWEGSWWRFTYQIEVNPGEWGIGGYPGEDGADRFYTMCLYSSGPQLYFVDLDQSLSLVQPAPTGEDPEAAERAKAAGLGVQPAEGGRLSSVPTDSSRYDLDHPTPYRFERSGPGYRLLIEGQRYSPLP
jgi:hypothetical protein